MYPILSKGIICSIGKNSEEVLANLMQSKNNIDYPKHINLKKENAPLKKVSEINYTDEELYNLVKNKSYINKKTDRSILLSMIAFEEAFEKLKQNKGYDKNKKIGIFGGTCVLETRSLEKFYIDYLNNKKL
ncbi:hypothetical protein [Arcobacter vandammei]|uniref:hypothetical protein n=1 Tax=Arcobacter vandammei TaxID=2782243 RepID=UPI0018E05F3B|nr:hypothetical protein [Arcobacter vandammei]